MIMLPYCLNEQVTDNITKGDYMTYEDLKEGVVVYPMAIIG